MAEVLSRDAEKMITATPARILGISGKKGDLAVGKDADILIFDSNITIIKTIINGKIKYDRQFDRIDKI